jgi:hypothetical protein
VDQRFDVEMLHPAQGGVGHAQSMQHALFTFTFMLIKCITHVLPAVSHHGSVLAPLQLDPQYRSLARDRSQAAGRKTRVMQVIDDPRNLLLRPMPVGYTKRKVRLCFASAAPASGGVMESAAMAALAFQSMQGWLPMIRN